MSTATMPIADKEMPHANDHEDGTPQEDTPEIPSQEIDNALRDDNQGIQTQETDDAPQKDNENIQLQETNNAVLDTSLHECHVEMIAIDDIYTARDGQHDALVNALADSIAHIGLQNPICVVLNDIEGNAATYRIISGRKRHAAFVKLGRHQIPAHILTFPPEDHHKDARKKLAEYEENLVRDQLSLLELCEYLGKSKAVYEELYPETKHGGAPKKPGKDPGTRSLPYVLNSARMLGKSRATIGKLLQIYSELIAANRLGSLKALEHPILQRVEDLSELAKKQDDIPTLVDILYKSSDETIGTFCSLQDAQHHLTKRKENEARQQTQKATVLPHAPIANTTKNQPTDTTESPEGSSATSVDKLTDGEQSSPADPGRPAVSVDRKDAQDEDTLHDAFVDIEELIKEYLKMKGIEEKFHLETDKTSHALHIDITKKS